MDEITIKCQKRTAFGKTAIKKIREEGLVPFTVYHIDGPFHGTIERNTANKIVAMPNAKCSVFQLEGADKHHAKCILKNADFDAVKDYPIYFEFQAIASKKTVEVEVPLLITGFSNSVGIKRGGKLNVVNYRLPLICNANKIPSQIEIDISSFGIGKTLHLSKVNLPKDVSFAKDVIVLSLIGRGKADKEEEGATAASA